MDDWKILLQLFSILVRHFSVECSPQRASKTEDSEYDLASKDITRRTRKKISKGNAARTFSEQTRGWRKYSTFLTDMDKIETSSFFNEQILAEANNLQKNK